ncbi:MAG: hypothetical protein WAL70_08205 [Aeromicrobium sp.]
MSVLAKVALVTAPLVVLAARFLLVPYWDEADVYIRDVAEDPGRSDLGASLVIVGAMLLLGSVLVLARLVAVDHPRIAVTGAILAVIGCVGMACVSMAALVAGQMVRLGDTEASVALWDRVWNSDKLWPIMTVHLGALGFIVLAVGLFRAGAVPRAAAVVVGLGGATTMTTAAGPIRPLLIIAAAIALVGFTWVAREDSLGMAADR